MAARFSAKFQVVINEDACFLFLFFLSLKFGRAQNSCLPACCCWYIKQRKSMRGLSEWWGDDRDAFSRSSRVRKEQVLSERIISACLLISALIIFGAPPQLASNICVGHFLLTHIHTQSALAFLGWESRGEIESFPLSPASAEQRRKLILWSEAH